MTDNVCYSILKTATQQIIQSAGFEAASNNSIDTLADVFGKYLELLGSTVSAYANLNGRTIGNALDLVEAMNEVTIEPKKLKLWLEEEGKALTPCWSAQSDPGRLIQGIITGGRPNFEEIIEYKFGQDVHEYNVSSSPSPQSPPSPFQEQDSTLPNYIPSYFPPFPEIKEDEVMEESDKVLFQKQQQLLQQKKEQEEVAAAVVAATSTIESLPLPVLVKNRKKPIENPFTHIIPFEDSSLATDNEDGTQQQALSLLVEINSKKKRSDEEEEEFINKRRKVATISLMNALLNVKSPNYKLGEGIIGRDDNDELFKSQTQNAAAPGNYLFNRDIGVFDQIVRTIADPMVISKLTAPNLQTDITMFNSNNSLNSTPLVTPTTTTTPLIMNGFHDIRSSPGPTSPDGHSRFIANSSMLAALAGGNSSASASKKTGLKKLNSSSHIGSTPMSLSALSNQTLSKHSIDINAIKTGDSKYIIKKKRLLAEKQQQEAAAAAAALALANGTLITHNSSSIHVNSSSSSSINVSSSSINVSSSSSNSINVNSSSSSSINVSSSSSINVNSSSSINTNSSNPNRSDANSNTNISSNTTTTTTGPISLSSFSASSTLTKKTNGMEKEKKKHKVKAPKLTLNLSAPKSIKKDVSPSPSPSPSPNTPRIKFKLKPPEQQQQSNKTPKHISLQQYKQQKQQQGNILPIKLEKQHMLSSPIPQHQQQHNNDGYSAEEIRCICENPTVDYGTFMIACDKCSVWFHGSCVGKAESDQEESWYCKRCRR